IAAPSAVLSMRALRLCASDLLASLAMDHPVRLRRAEAPAQRGESRDAEKLALQQEKARVVESAKKRKFSVGSERETQSRIARLSIPIRWCREGTKSGPGRAWAQGRSQLRRCMGLRWTKAQAASRPKDGRKVRMPIGNPSLRLTDQDQAATGLTPQREGTK